MWWILNRAKAQHFTFTSRSLKSKSGFTLVELIVVTALIVVLASLAISIALRARMQSNEAATVGNLRTVSSAAEAFRGTQNPPSYATALSTMITAIPPYLDSSWTGNQRQGYNYSYLAAGDGETFSMAAAPRTANVSGLNSYCVDHTGIIRRYSAGASATDRGCDASGLPI